MEYHVLEEKLPVKPAGEMVLGLETMRKLMGLLDNPQDKVPVIHIAGTNGKGSVATFLQAVLRQAGYKVGLFTSPSLTAFNERIQIDGHPVSDEALLGAVDRLNQATVGEDVSFTEFELFTALAYDSFVHESCDVAIMEVGLGGRLDATNVVDAPELTIITRIGFDHQAILGESLAEITAEKAAIMKRGVPVVVYPQADRPVVREVIRAKAHEMDADVIEVAAEACRYEQDATGGSVHYQDRSYRLGLTGEHQAYNAGVAIEAIKQLQKQGWQMTEAALQNGLAQAQLPGRYETIQGKSVTFVMDGGHNQDGLHVLSQNLTTDYSHCAGKMCAIVGMLADKVTAEVKQALHDVLSHFDHIITVTPHSDRGLPAEELARLLEAMAWEQPVTIAAVDAEDRSVSYDKAVTQAIQFTAESEQPGMICAFGSFYMVGQMRKVVLDRLAEGDKHG